MKKITFLFIMIFLLLSCKTNEVKTDLTPLNNNLNQIESEENLREAIRENDLILLREILDTGSINLNPPHIDNLINKPLAYAVQFGTLDSIKIILEYDVDINGQVSYGDVPLLKALENKKFDIATYLINQGADLNIPNSFGYSPFIGMCMLGYKDLVLLSTHKGARINESFMVTTNSNFGSFNLNSLQVAVKGGHKDIVKILLENGGDPELKSDGVSALDLANNLEDEELLILLEEYIIDEAIYNITEIVNLQISNNSGETVDDYQYNADIVRLKHLKYYGELLNEYFLLEGKYPFQFQEDRPVYVNIANDKQEEFTKEPLPFDHKLFTHKEFIHEIERVLDGNVEEYFDPQYFPDLKPNFYIYSVSGKSMFFAIHVGNEYSFSKKVAHGYHKVELSNMLIPHAGLYTSSYLNHDKSFLEELNKPILNVGYFLEREELYIHYSDELVKD